MMINRSTTVSVLILLWCGLSLDVHAQETLHVTYIAGSTFFTEGTAPIDAQTGDTLRVSQGPHEGNLLLIEAMQDGRMVLSYASEPFPVTLSDELVVVRYRSTAARSPLSDTAQAPPALADPNQPNLPRTRESIFDRPSLSARPDPVDARRQVRISGRIQASYHTLRSTTEWPEGDGWNQTTRTFHLPTLRVQSNIAGLPGGATLRLSSRIGYRSGIDAGSWSTRLYTAALELPVSPLAGGALSAGRMYQSLGSYYAYADGLRIQGAIGNRTEATVITGYIPDYNNERLSLARPVTGLHLDHLFSGKNTTVRAQVGGLVLRPDSSFAARTMASAALMIRHRGLMVRGHIEEDGADASRGWFASRAGAEVRVDLNRLGSVSVAIDDRTPWLSRAPEAMWGTSRQNLTASYDLGVGRINTGVYGRRASLGGDASYNTVGGHIGLTLGRAMPLQVRMSHMQTTSTGTSTQYTTMSVNKRLGQRTSMSSRVQWTDTERRSSTYSAVSVSVDGSVSWTDKFRTLASVRYQHATRIQSMSALLSVSYRL
ncbi:MAG: hypothetical protein EB075_00985 [Bacteroidetes bacterium]|nr:hypothetical protein [Bacteroidota bacterium]